MKRLLLCLSCMVAGLAPVAAAAAAKAGEPVVLLHGLARTANSMGKLESALQSAGYRTCNVSYPSRMHTIEALAADHVGPQVVRCFPEADRPIHFVTHSLGGIVVRQLASAQPAPRIGRVVMLSPPNHGSEVVDELGTWWLFTAWNGPAGIQLGTGADSVPLRLGAAPFEAGVITGTRTVNPILSMFIPGDDDGKVSVESARLEGMRDFLAVPASHPFIMRDAEVIEQTIHFLRNGMFRRPT